MPEINSAFSSRLYYRKMGSGPAIVLLHGFPENSSLWQNIWDRLSASFTLIIPDLPGSGNSTLNSQTTIEQLARVVKEILDKETIKSAVVAGHSMGGYVALAFAGLFPAAVEGISLVHSMPNADDEEKKAMRTKAIELIQNGGREAFIRQMIPNLFSDSFKQSNPYIVKQRIEESLGMSSDALINFYQAMRERPDTTGVLFSAKFPLQWIIGLNDNIMSYKKILLECHHSPINFVTFYDNCGHMSMMEAPQRLADDLEEFGKYCNHYFRNGNA